MLGYIKVIRLHRQVDMLMAVTSTHPHLMITISGQLPHHHRLGLRERNSQIFKMELYRNLRMPTWILPSKFSSKSKVKAKISRLKGPLSAPHSINYCVSMT